MVKQYYKNTDLGLIPNDWQLCKLGDEVKVFRGGSPRPIQNFLTQDPDGINWIKIGDVRENDKYIVSTKEKIIPEGMKMSREVHKGDFILSNSMSFGRPYILKIDGCIHDGWLAIQKYENLYLKEYLYYLLSSEIIYKQYLSMAAGSSVQNLNKEKVESLIVICPSKAEQEMIAQVLSDIDSLIDSLEKLIKKKKNIKQGVMQELLTGKKRLPGFNGEWKISKVDDIFTYVNGRALESYFNVYDGFKVISIGNFSTESKYINNNCFVDKKYKSKLEKLVPSCGDLVMILNDKTQSGAILGRTIFIDEDDGYIANQRSLILKLKESYCSQFFYFLFNSQNVRKEEMELAKPGTQIYLNLPDILNISLEYPADVKEQEAIASVLSDMDEEVEALEQKLEKYRVLKQGMMQQLLTGKIRLG